MAKGLLRSISRGSSSRQKIIKQTIRVDDLPITINGASGDGFGTVVAADLPKGNILFLGAVSYLRLSTTSAGVVDSYQGGYSIGTSPATSATFSGTVINIVTNGPVDAVSKVTSYGRATNATQSIFDNTDGSLEININVLIDDASISSDGNLFTLDGIVEISYIIMLDD